MNNRKNQEIFSAEEQLRNEQAVQALIVLPTVKLIATSDNEATQQLNFNLAALQLSSSRRSLAARSVKKAFSY